MQLPGVAWMWCPLLHLLLIVITYSRRGVEGLQNVKIGALFAVNSPIGEVALTSLQLAVQDVNANASILSDHELLLETVDSSCNAFQGAAAAVELLKGEVVAVAGPQTSLLAQFAADLGVATQVPFVSFAATDPTLTKASNPYFLRTLHNDAVDMEALASLVGLYGWRDVTAVSTDDYLGLNSLDALSDAMNRREINVVYKANISPATNSSDMVKVLKNLAILESRVIVVHLQPSIGRLFFNTAQSLSMMTTGYVWMISEAMSGMLEDLPSTDSIWSAMQGVVAVRSYIPPSPQLNSFQQRWSSQQPTNLSSGAAVSMNVYGMHAYDTVWMIAQAIDAFFRSGKNFTFIPRATLPARAGGGTELASLKILEDGDSFVQIIKDTQFVGITGPVQMDNHGDLMGSNYEILNVIGKNPRVVGYWNSDEGFSPFYSSNFSGGPNASTTSYSKVATDPPLQLHDVIWPGGSAKVPKGWVAAKNGQKLLIGVPLKLGFPEFVDIRTNLANASFHGFCIDVFEAAVSYLPYSLNYTYVPYGNGISSASYDDLIEKIADKSFDAVVGDVSITTKRSKLVDFTQPYIASGLVVIVPTKDGSNHAWDFMRPFTPLMWCTTGACFLFTGLTIWILEHKKNKDFHGKPKKQLVTVLWFIFSTLFFLQRENTKSTLGRAVLIIWPFVVLIIISSYTASLTSILTVQQLMPTVPGIAGLVSSNLAIGYQAGSYVEDYLLQMNVPKGRLIALDNKATFANALSTGYVGAIVDELPYVQVFLASQCGFTIAGQEFTKSGWGFAFPKGSQLDLDISTAILQMSEDGHLQQIQDYWLNDENCGSSSGLTVDSDKFGLSTFWGLFLITGIASICCVTMYYSHLIWQHHKTYIDDDTESDRSCCKSFLRSLVSFIEKSEVAGARRDAVGANSSTRKNSRIHRRSEFGMECGVSAQSQDHTTTTTPEHSHNIAVFRSWGGFPNTCVGRLSQHM